MSHPLMKVTVMLRAWLALFTTFMFFNMFVAQPITLGGNLRPVPFAVMGVIGIVWWWWVWSAPITIMCSATVTAGVMMRAVEVLFFLDRYTLNTRLTGASIWVFISGTTMLFGLLSLIAITRRLAEQRITRHDQ